MYSDQNTYSYGDMHNYQQQRHPNHSHDHRNGSMSRQEPRGPYGYSQGQAQRQNHPHGYQQALSHQPSSPHKYASRDYRGSNIPRSSDPRKNFATSGAYRNYAPSGGYRSHQHQKPPTSNYNNGNKGIRKDTKLPQHHKPSSKSEPSKKTDSRKSLAPEEKGVTFDDKRKEGGNIEHSSSSCAIPTVSSTEPSAHEVPGVTSFDHKDNLCVDTALNRTFTMDDGESPSVPTTNLDDVAAINLPPSDNPVEVDSVKTPPTSQECTILENSYVQEVVISSEIEITCSNSETQAESEPVVKDSLMEPPVIIVTEPECQETGEIDKIMKMKCETEVGNMGHNADSADHEGVAQLTEELVLASQDEPVMEFHEVVVTEDGASDVESWLVDEVIEPQPTYDALAKVTSAPLVEYTSEPLAEDPSEPLTEDSSEPLAENPSEPLTEDSSEPLTEDSSEPLVENPSEPLAEKPSEPLAENPSEPLAENPSEPLTENPSEPLAENPSKPLAENPSEPLAEGPSEPLPKDTSDHLAGDKQGPSTPEPKKVVIVDSPMDVKDSHRENTVDTITENLDVLYITPGRKGRKSRALVDTTNIVESSSIQYVVREIKQKEALDSDVVITPVRRSTRKKAETPGTLKNTHTQDIPELSPGVLQKAKIVPNHFLPS